MTPWLSCPKPNPQARQRLFCFPYAGGSSRIYWDWPQQLPQVEVCLIELPGRGRRMADPPITQLSQLVPQLSQALLPWLDRPFACFGHSLGALMAFELSHWLRQHQQPMPNHLWVSAARAPHLTSPDPLIHGLPRAEFMVELRRYNGTPAAILENVELMDLMLPTLRADFALLETYRYQARSPLPCPVAALWGKADDIVAPEEIEPWQVHTQGAFSLTAIPGDHFFIHQPQAL
ncbi:MAG: alpha/beta fold hydrolase, partial [Cyanobacteria bacterium P01_A01_bin.135]